MSVKQIWFLNVLYYNRYCRIHGIVLKTRGCVQVFYSDIEKLETLRARYGGEETSVGNLYETTGNRLHNRLHRTTFYGENPLVIIINFLILYVAAVSFRQSVRIKNKNENCRITSVQYLTVVIGSGIITPITFTT